MKIFQRSKNSKVKINMFQVLHYSHPAIIYLSYCWLPTCKRLLGRFITFMCKSFYTKICCNYLKRSTVQMSSISFQEQSVGWRTGRLCIHGFSTKSKVLHLFWYHDVMTSMISQQNLCDKNAVFCYDKCCEYQFQLMTGLC